MAGRVADGGLGQETVDARGRRKIRMAGSNRLRNPGGAIVLAGSREITRTRKPDVWKRSTARSGPRTTSNAYEGLTMQQSNSLNRMARAAGLPSGQTGAREIRARLDAGEVRGTGALRNYTPRTSVSLPGAR
jgi:hypothetical protein